MALNERLSIDGVERLGLVSPYVSDVQNKIIKNYRSIGVTCIAEDHLSISDNFSFAEVSESTLDSQVRNVAKAAPQAIATYCTNLHAAQVVSRWEREHGIPIFDTTATVIWKILRMIEVDPQSLRGWGQLFTQSR
ncbi:hypothetical protein [Vreelandella profundi]|uniref:aspartate racemase/maleate isomerase family protein n=1 Tax=Vreelandella profundi TaxID=2852117 RepID=UPI00235554AC|nr:hypothetical protein [Halomonas profundi]